MSEIVEEDKKTLTKLFMVILKEKKETQTTKLTAGEFLSRLLTKRDAIMEVKGWVV